jgi:hypothetical protein
MGFWTTAHNNLLLASIQELHLMLYLKDISSIKCSILERSQIILILAKQDLYWLSRTIVLFGIDRTLWTSSVLTKLSLQIGLRGFSNSTNGLFLSDFITSNSLTSSLQRLGHFLLTSQHATTWQDVLLFAKTAAKQIMWSGNGQNLIVARMYIFY